MSAKAKAMYNLYKHGKITATQLQRAVQSGIITQEECELIIA